MILTRAYRLDVVPGSFPLIIRASQGDSSSALVLSLFAGTGVLEIPSGAAVSIRGKTLGGNYCEETCTLQHVSGVPKVTAALTAGMTGTKGLNPFELAIESDEEMLVTATFYLDVR